MTHKSKPNPNAKVTRVRRASKSFSLGGNRKLELIGQVFNVFGTDNLEPVAWVTNALSNAFGRINLASNRQQAELAVRFAF